MSRTNFLSIICKLLLNTSNHQETFSKLSFLWINKKLLLTTFSWKQTSVMSQHVAFVLLLPHTIHHQPLTDPSHQTLTCVWKKPEPRKVLVPHTNQPLFYFFFHSSIKEDSRPTFPPSNKSLDKQPNIWPMHLLPTSLTRGQQLQCLPQTCQKKLQKQ